MAIEKVNFRVYADGEKRILVVEDCSGETLEAFNRIMEALCRLPAGTAQKVPAVEEDKSSPEAPAVEEKNMVQQYGENTEASAEAPSADTPALHFPDIILLSGEYAGMTPKEAVESDGIKAVTAICECSKDIEQEAIRKQVVDCCKHIIALDLSSRPDQMENGEELASFFSAYRPILGGKCIKALRDKQGIDIDEAIRTKEAGLLAEAYRCVIADLRDRTKD